MPRHGVPPPEMPRDRWRARGDLMLARDRQSDQPRLTLPLQLHVGNAAPIVTMATLDEVMSAVASLDAPSTPTKPFRLLSGLDLHLAQGALLGLSSTYDLRSDDPTAGVEMPPYALIDDFLTASELALVREAALARAERFVPATTLSSDPDARSGLVLYETTGIAEPFFAKLVMALPLVFSELGSVIPRLTSYECQMTAYADCGYYGPHVDNGSERVARRQLSYTYFALADPPGFSGGTLALYANSPGRRDSPRVEIEPKINRLVVFPSSVQHEVLQVHGGTGISSARLTVNGWIS